MTFNEQITQYLGAPESVHAKSKSLPRTKKPPVPKPRKAKVFNEPNIAATAHLSTSEGDLGEACFACFIDI